ncbi:MAG: hypothetical protein M0Z60_02765, partial [Nitrospiraceae bacterium]|nr:hypothetical protein [Nitrospiraceae bacterium]
YQLAVLGNVTANEAFGAATDLVDAWFSAWSDADGRYTLYVTKGKYHLGSAAAFPPGETYVAGPAVTVDGDKAGMDIVRDVRKGR